MHSNSPHPVPQFTWPRFLTTLVTLCVVVGAVVGVWYKSSGEWNSSFVGVILAFAWLQIFLGFRWHSLRKEQFTGVFSEEKFRANPSAYIFGSTKNKWLATGIAAAILIVNAMFSADG